MVNSLHSCDLSPRPFIPQFAMVECVVTGLSDEYPKYLRRYKPFFLIGVCVLMFLLAIPMCSQVTTFHLLQANRTFVFHLGRGRWPVYLPTCTYVQMKGVDGAVAVLVYSSDDAFTWFFCELCRQVVWIANKVLTLEQGWRSGESARLPPMCLGFDTGTRRHMWAEFVGTLLREVFLRVPRFSPLWKKTTFDLRIVKNFGL